MNQWEHAKRAQTRQLFWALGLFAVTCLLFSWRYMVSANSAPQIVSRAPLTKPRLVMFDISSDLSEESISTQTLANQALYQSLINEKRWEVISPLDRDILLDPAWTKAPNTLEEALEIGRETGADWALQAELESKSDFYRISFKLIALSPEQLEPSEEEKRNLFEDFSQDQLDANSTQTSVKIDGLAGSDESSKPPKDSTQDPSLQRLIDTDKGRELPKITDFNTLDVSQLLLVEHISWVTEPATLKSQLDKVGKLLFIKAQHRIEQKRAKKLEALKKKETSPKPQKKRKKSLREIKAIELSEAAQRELDDIQARLNAEYEQRKEEERIKREVLAEEAKKAWTSIEKLSGDAGLLTVKVEVITKVRPPRGRWGAPRPLKKPQTMIQPARATWDQISQVTQNRLGLSLIEQKDKLLNFMHKYKDVPKYRAHVEEARNRYTWLNRAEIEWVKIYGHEFPVGGSLLAKDDTPVSWVNIKSFEISVSEVTNAQYKRCVDAKVCSPPHWDDKTCEISGGRRVIKEPLPAIMRRGDLPVVCITWDQATRYATWVGGRLLSESEWEFAARSGDRYYIYPWGRHRATCALAVMNNGLEDGCGFKTMLPACSKMQGNNSAGVCDLAGNVWEWVADSYLAGYQNIPQDGSPRVGGNLKVIRGGSFVGDRHELSSSTRGQLEKQRVANIVGFRVARPLQEF